MSDEQKCPRCGGTAFQEFEGGSDTYEDFTTYTSEKCRSCGLWYDGWRSIWLTGVDDLSDEEDGKEWRAEQDRTT